MSELSTTYLGTMGIAALFLTAAVVVVAGGVVDEHITPLWNPAVLAAAGLGPAYAAPRVPMRVLFAGGIALGLYYGATVFLATALTGSADVLGPGRLFVWAGAIGAIPPTAAGAFYRWLSRRARHTAP